jgi:hypothetical protein
VGIVYVWEGELEWKKGERECDGLVVRMMKEKAVQIEQGYRRRLVLHKLWELRWEQK